MQAVRAKGRKDIGGKRQGPGWRRNADRRRHRRRTTDRPTDPPHHQAGSWATLPPPAPRPARTIEETLAQTNKHPRCPATFGQTEKMLPESARSQKPKNRSQKTENKSGKFTRQTNERRKKTPLLTSSWRAQDRAGPGRIKRTNGPRKKKRAKKGSPAGDSSLFRTTAVRSRARGQQLGGGGEGEKKKVRRKLFPKRTRNCVRLRAGEV